MFTVRGLYNRQRSLGLGTARRGAHGIWLSSSSSSSFGGGARIDQSHTQSTHKCTQLFWVFRQWFQDWWFFVCDDGVGTRVFGEFPRVTPEESYRTAQVVLVSIQLSIDRNRCVWDLYFSFNPGWPIWWENARACVCVPGIPNIRNFKVRHPTEVCFCAHVESWFGQRSIR